MGDGTCKEVPTPEGESKKSGRSESTPGWGRWPAGASVMIVLIDHIPDIVECFQTLCSHQNPRLHSFWRRKGNVHRRA